MVASQFTRIDSTRVVQTAIKLQRRIEARFPRAQLRVVAAEVANVAGVAGTTAARLARPAWWRAPLALGLLAATVMAGALLVRTVVTLRTNVSNLAELLQAIEAGINDVVLLGAGVFFLATWERRIKRAEALRELHQLRSLAHVIDMHQLTKDPEHCVSDDCASAAADGALTLRQLVHYLDYCTELLAIIGKIAALYSECLDDAVSLAAVGEIESLASGLSNKIWQKIVLTESRSGLASGV